MTMHSAVAVAPARLHLLGAWQLLVGGEEVRLGHREQRLVALLGLADRGTRGNVASQLWPDSTDERALASLRRAVLQCQRGCPGLLVAGRVTVVLDPSVESDVADLRRAAGLTSLPMTDPVARELATALRGAELLPGWYDDWVVEDRRALEQLRVEGLERVARHGLDHEDPELAIDAARWASGIEPLRESVRETAIRAYVLRGDVGGAMTEFRTYEEVVRDELGVAPSSRILALVEPLLESAADRVAPLVVPRPRAEPVPLEPAPPGAVSVEEFLAGRVRSGRRRGRPRVAVPLVAAAAVAVGVALAVLVPDEPRAPVDPGAEARVTQPASPADQEVVPPRTVKVRTVDTADGSAVFAVRATRRPAQVRLVVRGPAGLRVVRHLVVRDAAGRHVRVEGLAPGTYAWSATSESATDVRGQVSVVTPAAEPPDPTPGPTTSVTPDVTEASATTTPASGPTTAPTTQPSPTPTSSPTQSHTPSPTPSPSPSPSPTGTPTDPGTEAPSPVG